MQIKKLVSATQGWSRAHIFVFAATGAAVGLGNVWKFPSLLADHGGSAFLLVYVACLLLISWPLLILEVLVGRASKGSIVEAIGQLARSHGLSPRWGWIGVSASLAGLMLSALYTVVAGWVLYFTWRMASGAFVAMPQGDVKTEFVGLLANWNDLLFWQTAFVGLLVAVAASGVVRGMAHVVSLLVTLMFVVLAIMLGFGLTTGEVLVASERLLAFRVEQLSFEAVLLALGQAFFTLSLGMGAMMVFGAYMPKGSSLGLNAFKVVFLDLAIAVALSVLVVALVTKADLNLTSGPELLFVALPSAFGAIEAGQMFGVVFYFLVVLIAWTSALALLEPTIAWWMQRFDLNRLVASFITAYAAWMVGVLALSSFNLLSGWKVAGLSLFNLVDFLVANVLLPLSAFALAILAGWLVSPLSLKQLHQFTFRWGFALWFYALKFAVPVALVSIFSFNLLQKLALSSAG
ncbi:MAG: sodium-dependent transporter [Pontibacterium sp.]